MVTPVVQAWRTQELAFVFAQLNIATTVALSEEICGSLGAEDTTSISSILIHWRPLDDVKATVTVLFAETETRGMVYLM
ncbi:hypothetical protein WS70_08725 [Burkholderia mayonis]|uniref:Uncharacterized protein n=1 Tax=Burkholderia mayonis TaxID=1385591 RepID=A0A1B4FDX5_9BURK|nr:hypothetical protein WS70_08725 [Burkholderia mayonis]KVE46043.1 hypothetical protein WS70_03125 [Burkholderia mayonis]